MFYPCLWESEFTGSCSPNSIQSPSLSDLWLPHCPDLSELMGKDLEAFGDPVLGVSWEVFQGPLEEFSWFVTTGSRSSLSTMNTSRCLLKAWWANFRAWWKKMCSGLRSYNTICGVKQRTEMKFLINPLELKSMDILQTQHTSQWLVSQHVH